MDDRNVVHEYTQDDGEGKRKLSHTPCPPRTLTDRVDSLEDRVDAIESLEVDRERRWRYPWHLILAWLFSKVPDWLIDAVNSWLRSKRKG